MKCMVCGAEIPEGSTFCTTCGSAITPAPMAGDDLHTVLLDENGNSVPEAIADATGRQGAVVGDDTRTMLINETENAQAAAQSFQQSGLNPMQPQMGFAQPQMGQPMQPQMGGMTGYNQPMQPQMGQPMGQPQMGGMTGYGQPMQPQMGQPMGQPMMGQPMQAPKKPLSPGAKKGIIIGAIAAVLLAVFFIVVLPILTQKDLAGSYTGRDGYKMVFSDGTYVIYDDDNEISEAGTYVYNKKAGTAILTDLEDNTTDIRFDKKKNIVYMYSTPFSSVNKKEKLDFTLSAGAVDAWEKQIQTASEELVANETLYDEIYWSGYDIEDDTLKNPDGEFGKQLAAKLSYGTDKAFSTLVEGGYLEFDVYITYDGKVEIYTYVW